MKQIQDIFGIKTENEEFYRKALTHPSYTKEKDLAYTENYERLEFLGDAVLKLMISDILYRMYPASAEGELSKIRSIAVSDNTLSKISEQIGLNELIIASPHEIKQGVRKLESVTACAFEAVLGAYYLDGKFNELLGFIKNIFVPYIEEINSNFGKYNAKAILQEYTQGLTKETPVYKLINTTGPDHNKTFEVQVAYRGEVVASGSGRSKKDAEQKAAYEACIKLGAL